MFCLLYLDHPGRGCLSLLWSHQLPLHLLQHITALSLVLAVLPYQDIITIIIIIIIIIRGNNIMQSLQPPLQEQVVIRFVRSLLQQLHLVPLVVVCFL